MKRLLGTRRSLLPVMAAALAVIVTAQSVVLAETLTKRGKGITAVTLVTGTDFISSGRTAVEWADMPGVTTTVSVPSNTRAHFLVTFASETNCGGGYANKEGYCLVRVLVDGAPASPGDVVFDSRPDSGDVNPYSEYSWTANSMQFVSGPLAAGSHTVKVQWRVNEVIEFWAAKRTLTVLRTKV